MELHNAGYSDKELAEKFQCEPSNIVYHLKKSGISGRTKSKKDNIDLRNRISQTLKGRYVGEKNPNFKGYTDEKTIARGMFKSISKQCIRDRDFTCEHCNHKGGNLETHHIKPFKIIFFEFIQNVYDGNINHLYDQLSQYNDFINTDNMVVLCYDCHHKVHFSDDPELSPYRWESATTIESIA